MTSKLLCPKFCANCFQGIFIDYAFQCSLCASIDLIYTLQQLVNALLEDFTTKWLLESIDECSIADRYLVSMLKIDMLAFYVTIASIFD